MENIDIFDADLRPRGQKERRAAHFDGDWHKTFHLWVVGGLQGGSVLYQWRSHEMENFPDMLDVSAAGHVLAGESVELGIREAEEELGIKFDSEKLHDLGYRVEVADQTNGQRNREYQAVHMAKVDKPIADFNPQVEEVSGLYWIGLAEGMELFTGKRETVTGSGIIYDASAREWKPSEREFNRDRFLPRIQNYYLTAHIMAERLLENRMPLSIS
jgi:isopentenyldiphosphate isomerase